jgi:hypothetical protein
VNGLVMYNAPPDPPTHDEVTSIAVIGVFIVLYAVVFFAAFFIALRWDRADRAAAVEELPELDRRAAA